MTVDEYISLKKAMRAEALESHLRRQDRQLEAIRQQAGKSRWISEFSSNVAGNAAWYGLLWVVRMLKK